MATVRRVLPTPTAGWQLGDVAGLIVRTRGKRGGVEKEEAWHLKRLHEASEEMRDVADRLVRIDDGAAPTARGMSARMGWWCKLWRECRSYHEIELMLTETVRFLEEHKRFLEAMDD